MTRGILSSNHVRPTRPVTQAELDELYAAAYGDEPFVRVVAAAAGDQAHDRQQPRAASTSASTSGPAGSSRIGVEDNLVKGAAGQAVQAFNLVHGLPETAGLEQLPLAPLSRR